MAEAPEGVVAEAVEEAGEAQSPALRLPCCDLLHPKLVVLGPADLILRTAIGTERRFRYLFSQPRRTDHPHSPLTLAAAKDLLHDPSSSDLASLRETSLGALRYRPNQFVPPASRSAAKKAGKHRLENPRARTELKCGLE